MSLCNKLVYQKAKYLNTLQEMLFLIIYLQPLFNKDLHLNTIRSFAKL